MKTTYCNFFLSIWWCLLVQSHTSTYKLFPPLPPSLSLPLSLSPSLPLSLSIYMCTHTPNSSCTNNKEKSLSCHNNIIATDKISSRHQVQDNLRPNRKDWIGHLSRETEAMGGGYDHNWYTLGTWLISGTHFNSQLAYNCPLQLLSSHTFMYQAPLSYYLFNTQFS